MSHTDSRPEAMVASSSTSDVSVRPARSLSKTVVICLSVLIGLGIVFGGLAFALVAHDGGKALQQANGSATGQNNGGQAVTVPSANPGQVQVNPAPIGATTTCPLGVDPALNVLNSLNLPQIQVVVQQLMDMRATGFRLGNATCLTAIYASGATNDATNDLSKIAGGVVYPTASFAVRSVVENGITTGGLSTQYSIKFTGTDSTGAPSTLTTTLVKADGWQFTGLN